jgi:hypothetical protein
MAKRATLTDFTTPKPQAATPGAAPEAPAEPTTARAAKADPRRGLTLRLSEPAWKQLKILAVQEGRHAHDLIIDGVNAVFEKHGKPPIA